MNREIIELREVIQKLVPMLTGKGLVVTQRGSQAYVSTDPRTKRPIAVNIPMISDKATPEFIRAIQGYIDHEVAHVLITDWHYYAGGESDPKKIRTGTYQAFQNTHNIVEDTMIEREIVKIFPGSRKNIADLRRLFISTISLPAILKAAGDPKQQFRYIIVAMMRALAGHEEFIEMMDTHKLWDNPFAREVMAKLSPKSLKLLRSCTSTKETLEIAKELHAILYPPVPPKPVAPPKPPTPPAEPDDTDKPDKKPEPGEGTGERDHDEPEEDADETPAKGAEDLDDKPEEKEEDDAEPDSDAADDGEPDAEPDTDDEPADGDDADAGEPEPDDASAETDDTDDDGDEDWDAYDPYDGIDDDGAADEAETSDDAERGDDAEDDTDAGDDESGDEDAEPDAAEGGAGEGDADATYYLTDEEPEDGEGSLGDITKGKIEGETSSGVDTTDPGSDGDSLKTDDGIGTGLFADDRFGEDDFKGKDMGGAIGEVITKEALLDLRAAPYTIFTREFDKIEPLEVGEIQPEWIPNMEDKVRQMIGRMQKDIERMMASQSHVIRTPGHRRGKLHTPSLFRVPGGDDRVFSQKQEHVSKDTVVSLLIDNSGSMHGRKQETACMAAYALSLTLERVNITHEVLGFTTTGFHAYDLPETMRRAMEDDLRKSGVRYNRTLPLYMPIYKGFDERVNATVKGRFARGVYEQDYLAGNIDGECLEYAAMRMMKRREKRKVMLVLSDGAPIEARDAPAHLRYMVSELTKKWGIDCIGIGILDSSVSKFYEKSCVLNRVEDLPGQVMQELKKILS